MPQKKGKKVNVVCDARLDKYFALTGKAISVVESSPKDESRSKEALDFLDMAQRYYSDAKHFRDKGNYVLAFAAVNYAHAWLDAGARIGLFKVKDDHLFAAD
jgi:uncharacterized protein